jgi:hypothetical protein
MNSTFELWTVENPMTVIASPYLKDQDYIHWGIRRAAQAWCFTAWNYKTMNLNTIKIILSLN